MFFDDLDERKKEACWLSCAHLFGFISGLLFTLGIAYIGNIDTEDKGMVGMALTMLGVFATVLACLFWFFFKELIPS